MNEEDHSVVIALNLPICCSLNLHMKLLYNIETPLILNDHVFQLIINYDG